MGLQTIKSDSTWGKASADINNNFDTLGSEITKVKNATTNNKGYFDTSEELIAMFPSGTSNQIAYVGKSHPYAIWKWDGTKWYDTKQTGGAESLDLNSYYPKKEVDEKFTETDAKLSELGSKIFNNSFVGNDNTFSSIRLDGLIKGNTYCLYLDNTDWVFKDSEYPVLLVNVIKDNSISQVLQNYDSSDIIPLNIEFTTPLADYDYIEIGGRATNGVEVKFSVIDTSYVKSEVKSASKQIGVNIENVKNKLNVGYFVGRNNDYVSTKCDGLIRGHRYRMQFVSMDWVFKNSIYTKLIISSYKNGESSAILSFTDNVPNEFNFIVPSDSDYIEIGGRAIEGKDVTFVLTDIEDINNSNLPLPIELWVKDNVYLDSQNKFVIGVQYNSVFIPCSEGSEYSIRGNDNISIVAFVRSNDYNNVADYAESASRTIIRNGDFINGIIPLGTKYLYVAMSANDTSYSPKSVIIDGYDYVGGYAKIIVSSKTLYEEMDRNRYGSIDEFNHKSYYIDTNNNWISNVSRFKCVFIPCKGGEDYLISANDINRALVAFVKTKDITIGEAVDFAEGSTKIALASGGTDKGMIPTDARYIYVCTEVDGNSWIPSTVEINGYNYSVGLKGNIEELRKSVSSVGSYKVTEVNLSDYDNLRVCLSSIKPSVNNRYIVNIEEGLYDIKSCYSGEEIAADEFRGLFVPNYVTLRGIGRKEYTILQWYNEDNEPNNLISVLNLRNVAGLETLTVNGRNIRYSIHDDFAVMGLPDEKKIFNLDVNIYKGVYNAAWGAGQKGNQTAVFESCNFYTDKNEKAWSSHNNVNVDRPSYIHFKSCTFKNNGDKESFGLSSLGNGVVSLTYVSIENCHIDNFVKIKEENPSVYGIGMFYQVSGFGNNIGNTGVQIVSSDGVDYSSRVKLVKYLTE